jgi:hypothetical protein
VVETEASREALRKELANLKETMVEKEKDLRRAEEKVERLKIKKREEEIWFNGTSTQKGHIVPEVW